MPVPAYQKLFLPILRFASDGQEHSHAQAVEAVVKHFNLTEDDCNELLPSGTQRKLGNDRNGLVQRPATNGWTASMRLLHFHGQRRTRSGARGNGSWHQH